MDEFLELRILAIRVHSVATLLLISLIILHIGNSQAEDARGLVDRYAELRLKYSSDNDLAEPLRVLLTEAETYRDANPTDPEGWLASARIRFGYANTQGPVRGMRLISESRDEIVRSVYLNQSTDRGFGLAFLGYLYVIMPRWPVSFGNRGKGWEYMEQALIVDSESVANKYFLTVILIAERRFEEAEETLKSAKRVLEESEEKGSLEVFYAHNLEVLEEQLFIENDIRFIN